MFSMYEYYNMYRHYSVDDGERYSRSETTSLTVSSKVNPVPARTSSPCFLVLFGVRPTISHKGSETVVGVESPRRRKTK